ncbi:MAG: PQQ-binding-like beta-propeller repeat protein [Alphaproteobacteria bacterium]|nr:PQQ-binding-like beta-propeller repeat protein [Alphaproteobacteria bacterium]
MKHRGFFQALILSGIVTGLAACSSDEAPLTGRRLSVLTYGSELMPDTDLKKSYLLPEPESVQAWTQAGGLSHHVMQNPAIAPKIMQAWRISIGQGGSRKSVLLAEPVGQKGILYTIDSAGYVQAVSASGGKKIWSALLPEKGSARRVGTIGTGLAVDDTRLFAALGTGEVVALDANNGTELWRVNLHSPIRSAPTVYGGRIFVITADNKLTALAQDDGRTLWQHYAFFESLSLMGKAAPAIDNGVGIAAFASGDVVAFRPENGSILWTESLGASRLNSAGADINDIRARPVIASDKVFVVSSGGLLSALDLKTGGVIWEREIGGVNQPWLAGDMLYVLSSYEELAALEASSGKILWVNKLSQWLDPEKKKKRLTWTGPVMAGSRLILVNSDGKAIAVAPQTGTIIGWDEIDDKGSLPPIVLENTLFFVTENGNLIAYK